MRMMTSAPGSLSPDSIAGLIGWWDPLLSTLFQNSNGTTAVANGDPVGYVDNLVTPGTNPMIQATGSAKPALNTTGINGRRALSLTTDDFLGADALAAARGGNDTPFTFACVLQELLAATSQSVLSMGRSASANPFNACGVGSAGIWSLNRRDDASATANTGGGAYNLVPHSLVYIFDGSQTFIFYDGGSLPYTRASNIGVQTFDRLTLGCLRRNTNSQFMTGMLGTALLYSRAITEFEARSLSVYLKNSYGL